jgi:hypothetical protein
VTEPCKNFSSARSRKVLVGLGGWIVWLMMVIYQVKVNSRWQLFIIYSVLYVQKVQCEYLIDR